MNSIVGDVNSNKNKIIDYINQAKEKQVDVILFPELSILGYPPKDLLLKPLLIEENTNALSEIAKHCDNIHAVIGHARLENNILFNSASVLHNNEIIGYQDKTYLPNYDVFDEKRYFSKSEKYQLIKINSTNVGITICEDVWKDGPVESLKELGAELILNLSASPFNKGKEKVREEVLENRSKQNKIPIAYCNLVGGQDDLIFDGHGYFFDENGTKAFETPCFEEGLFTYNTETKEKSTYLIKDVEQVHDALVLGLKDYFKKNGFKKAVIGLSGGIDSALTAAIACAALGSENVLGITMPSKYSSSGSVDDSYDLAHNLNMEIETIPIKSIYDSYIDMLNPFFERTEPNVAEENIQARIRGNLLMAMSNKFGRLVLTTGNKSELAVGYCTLYGDMSGGLAVISDVPKMLVYEVSKFINQKHEKEIIPIATIEKEPSAELRPDQKDSDSLPEYDILDEILEYYVDQGLDKESIIRKGYNAEIVTRIIKLVKINEYKRYQAALGFRVTSKAFGPGRRFPITNKWTQ